MRPLIFLDLDDTLFQTLRKCPPGDLTPAALDKLGEPLSFMAAHQCSFLEFLLNSADVIPTTGRNAAAYRRVQLEFSGYSICSHGGLILTPEGEPEPRWRSIVAAQSDIAVGDLGRLEETARRLAAASGFDVRSRVIEDDGLPLYVSIKHNDETTGQLSALTEEIRPLVPPDWTIHLNGNNMALLPPFVSKKLAVEWFRREIASPAAFTIGIGDSVSDAGFMSACDFALAPTESQLFRRLAEVCL